MQLFRSTRVFKTPSLSRPSRNFSNEVVLEPHSLAKHLSGKNLIDGHLVNPLSKKTFDVVNPATGKVIGNAADSSKEDVDRAVQSAKKAQKEWKSFHIRKRGNLVTECGNIIQKHAEELARLVTLESGKALKTEARVEANLVADIFRFFGGLGPEVKGENLPWSNDAVVYTVPEPVGVVGSIIPWNAPLLLLALKAAPALLTGNAMVLKPAEEAPLGALRLVHLLNQILPHGLFNVIQGDGPNVGAPLVSHPDVNKITFTGSVETGKIIYRTAADKLIPLTAEMGGKSPMIILPDCDINRAVDGAIVGMRFTRAGQSCTASSRIFVHEKIHDEFVALLKKKVDAMKMGNPLDDSTDMGAVISKDQYTKIKNYIDIGTKEKGVTKIVCNQLPTDPELKDGLFVQPVLLTGISNKSKVAQEEIFGPVTCIMKWNDFDDVLQQANDTSFGLSATIWTNDLHKAMRATKELQAGIVQVNQNFVVQPNLPVGGWKTSGLGREGSLEAVLAHFVHYKTVAINLK